MPAVMSPTPGGVTYYEAIDLIEFVPERDHDHVAAYTAARVVCHIIGCLARRR